VPQAPICSTNADSTSSLTSLTDEKMSVNCLAVVVVCDSLDGFSSGGWCRICDGEHHGRKGDNSASEVHLGNYMVFARVVKLHGEELARICDGKMKLEIRRSLYAVHSCSVRHIL
jgi:hypothetical protein